MSRCKYVIVVRSVNIEIKLFNDDASISTYAPKAPLSAIRTKKKKQLNRRRKRKA